MDSVTQFVLGAAVTAAALGARTRPLRAVCVGGFVGTLPDLDVLIDHGDAVANMVSHRGFSHSLVWMTLAAPLLAWAIAALLRELPVFRRWWLATWLALVTHALLDAMTIYGTRLLLPFEAQPFAVGSLFVIDPMFTLPLLVGTAALLVARDRGRRWNTVGITLAVAYAGASLVLQQVATAAARRDLAARGLVVDRVVVTPAPLQILLWRVIGLGEDHAHEGFWSPFDGRAIDFPAIDRGRELRTVADGIPAWRRLVDFSGDCLKLERRGDELRATDLRMGQEPHYVFSFVLATSTAGAWRPVAKPERSGARPDVGRGLAWLWPRMWGADLPSPR